MYINHRINTVKQLKTVPLQNGIELDIRYHNNNLILHHEPFHHHEHHPEIFEDLLKQWKHKGCMILNIKTEGIEKNCIDLMNTYQIQNWFFLDMSLPSLVKYAQHAANHEIKGFSIANLTVRFSEYEPIKHTLAFAGKAQWVWIDCFTHLPLNQEIYKKLKDSGYKICLASPELQRHPTSQIEIFKNQIKGFDIDAVCTKYPDLWS